MTPRLALRRVLVQPEFVLIDGDTVTDVDHPAVAIPAAEWPTYSSERFPAEVAAWQAELDASAESPADDVPKTGSDDVSDGSEDPNRIGA
jgi:hypothetical protein